MQGSGTFSVEAAINTLVPRDGHVLVLINGAYGLRLAKLTQMMGRKVTTFETAEDVPTTPADVDRLLKADASITHVGLIHCETSTGILNPLPEIAAVVERHGRSLIVDAMSSFGAIGIDARTTTFDALIAASGKCIEGPPGMGFVLVRKQRAREVRRQLDVARRSISTTSGRTWRRRRNGATRRRRTSSSRSTPRSTSMSPRAASRRGSRATRRIARRSSPALAELGFKLFLKPEIQAPIILTFHAPPDPAYNFKEFYARVRDKGFILYPGKLTKVETFRVGCIGAVGPDEMRHAVNAVRDTLREMGIRQVSPVAGAWRARRPERARARAIAVRERHGRVPRAPFERPHRPSARRARSRHGAAGNRR